MSRHTPLHQVCWFFPLKDQLRAMLQVPAYRELLHHEWRRGRCNNRNIMSDVYDTPRWEKVVGAATPHLTRIAVQLCVDGIPAFKKKERLSVKPIQYFVWSLPPWLRYLARHMLVQMLLPSDLKGRAAGKYFDFLANYEMNDLRQHGICGVKVILYGDTLDAPGRQQQFDNKQLQQVGNNRQQQLVSKAAAAIRQQAAATIQRQIGSHYLTTRQQLGNSNPAATIQ